jgi:hypothetical protein
VRAVTTSLFHRRRAERLAHLLDEGTGHPRHHARVNHDEELAGYVRLGDGLTRAAGMVAGPTEDFRTSLRAMLVAAAEREGVGVDDEAPEVGKRARRGRPVMVGGKKARGAVLVGLAAGTLALSGISAASGDAMPGDALYGVKRSTESARLALAGSDVSRGQLYLEFARNRLAEADETGARGDDLAGMLADMDNETRAGIRLLTMSALDRHDASALDVVDLFVRDQRSALGRLADATPTRPALTLLDRIAARSTDLRSALSCGVRATETDDLGPLVPACPGARPAAPHTGVVPGGSGAAPAGRPENTSTNGGTAPQPADSGTAPASPSPSPSPSGLLGDLGKLIGGGH